jgi:transposase
MAQENEIPDVLHMIGKLVDAASALLKLPPRIDSGGRDPFPEDDLAKFILAQQYDGRSNRVVVGLLKTWSKEMGIVQNRQHLCYKTLERAYDDPDVVALLNEVFFLTQEPVKDKEHEFAPDGTCYPTTIKKNWESSKDEILKIAHKQRSKEESPKERKRHEFEKSVLVVGTTFKIIAAFARTATPTSHESPYLRPLLNQVAELYAYVAKVCMDAEYLSRDNCKFVRQEIRAVPRIFPKRGITLNSKGSEAWKSMLLEFVNDTQKWLEEYHSRSIVETVNSTMKRLFPNPLRKKLVERRATELFARIVVYNIRQLVYLCYTNGIDLGGAINPKPNTPTLRDWMHSET